MKNIDTTVLAQTLVWIISGGGSAAISYFLMERVPALRDLVSEWKRYVSMGLAAAVAMLAFWGGIAMLYYPRPETVRAWIEVMFAISTVAIVGSQSIHARRKLRR